MFISTQSPHAVCPLPQERFAGLTTIDLEGLLTKINTPSVDIVDSETREQILQSLVIRMQQVRYLRRLPASKMFKKFRY